MCKVTTDVFVLTFYSTNGVSLLSNKFKNKSTEFQKSSKNSRLRLVIFETP